MTYNQARSVLLVRGMKWYCVYCADDSEDFIQARDQRDAERVADAAHPENLGVAGTEI